MQLLVGFPPRLVMNSRSFLASLLCASLASLAPTAAHAQLSPAGLSAAGQLATALAWDAKPVNTSVLGLRSEDGKAGEDLTAALRDAFAEREMSGGQELTLEEVVLTLDCSSEQDTACMTEAGRALETERLVYGTLTRSGGGHTLDIIVLDVTSGQIEAQATLPLDAGALSSDEVASTATEVVNSLYPQADPSALAPAPAGDPLDKGDDPVEQIEDDPKSGLVWGPYQPRPTWKKVGLGVSASLAVLGAAASITGWYLYKNEYEPRVVAARDILDDSTGGEQTPDYCRRTQELDVAQMEADGRLPAVQESRATACQNFLGARTVNVAGAAVAAVAGAATIVFLVLHFVHRDDSAAVAAKRRRFRLVGGPTPGGAAVGATARF